MNAFLEELSLFSRGLYSRHKIKEPPTSPHHYIDIYEVDWSIGARFHSCPISSLQCPGVYCLADESDGNDPVMYIGQSKNIKKRLHNHFNKSNSPFYKMARRLDAEYQAAKEFDRWMLPEQQLLFILSYTPRDERYFHRMLTNSNPYRLINDPTKLLRYPE